MTPWQRFWFPDADAAPAVTRDAALWSPQALVESQRAIWQQVGDAVEQWWRFWRVSWPTMPVSSPAGLLSMPNGASTEPERVSPRAAGPARSSAARRTPRPTGSAAKKAHRGRSRGA